MLTGTVVSSDGGGADDVGVMISGGALTLGDDGGGAVGVNASTVARGWGGADGVGTTMSGGALTLVVV